MQTSTITIRLATPEDQAAIEEGVRNWYWPYEPLSTGHDIKEPDSYEQNVVFGVIDEGTSLVACDGDERGKIVGFLTNTTLNFTESKRESCNVYSCPRYKAMIKIVQEMNNQIDMLKSYGIEKSFHFDTLAVNPQFRGNSVAYKLFQKGFQLAKSLGYKIVTVHCSSQYSANLSEKFGMKCVASIAYEDFKDSNGQLYFKTEPEHSHLRKYIMLID